LIQNTYETFPAKLQILGVYLSKSPLVIPAVWALSEHEVPIGINSFRKPHIQWQVFRVGSKKESAAQSETDATEPKARFCSAIINEHSSGSSRK
jgi:hypothetical protein